MTPMAYIMNLMKDGESYTIVIPAAEYFQIGKDPSIIAKYWEQLTKEQAKKKENIVSPVTADSQHSSKDGDQQNKEIISDKKDKSYWDIKTAGHLISLCHKHGINIDNPELNSALWNEISNEMNEQFPMFSISGEHCCQAFKKFVSAYKTIKSDPEKEGLKGELFAAVDRLVYAETDCQTTILQKDNEVLEISQADLSLKSKTCDSENCIHPSKYHTEVTEKIYENSQNIKVAKKLKMHKTSRSCLHSNASQTGLNSVLSKQVKKRNTVRPYKRNCKKIKRFVSFSPSNIVQTSVSYQTIESDPDRTGLKEEILTAVDRPVNCGNDCQTTILQKDNAVLKRSEADLSLRNSTCDSKDPAVSPKNYTKISGKMSDSTKKLKMCITSKSCLPPNASQAMLNCKESCLSKPVKRNTVQPCKINSIMTKSSTSLSPSNLIQASLSNQTIKSDPEKTELQELSAVDGLVHTGTDCQTTILQKDNAVLERSKAELSLRNNTCGLKDPTVSSKNYSEVSGEILDSSKKLKMCITSESLSCPTVSQVILNSAESVLLKQAKIRNIIQPCKINSKKVKNSVSLTPNLIPTVSSETIKSDPEKIGLQGELFTAVDRHVHTGTDCQTTVLQKDNAVLEISEAELSLRNNSCDSKGPTVFPKNHTEVSGKMPDSSKKLKMRITSKSRLHSTASQAIRNSAESVLLKRTKKKNSVQSCAKISKKMKRTVSLSPSNLNQTSVSPGQVNPTENDNTSETMSQGDKPHKICRSCSCQNTLPPKWFFKFEEQFECRWEHLAKMAQDQISAVNDLVRVLRQWVNFEHDLQTPRT